MPNTLIESEFEALARGMMVIFPNLERCNGWNEINWELAEIRESI